LTYWRGFIECGDNEKRRTESSYILVVDRESEAQAVFHMRIPLAQHVTQNCLPRASSAIIKKKKGLVGHFFNKRQDRRFLWDTLLHRGPSFTITLPSLNRNHHHCHRECRPFHRYGRGASCICCKLLRLLCRSTHTVRCDLRTVKVPFSCKLGRRRHLYVAGVYSICYFAFHPQVKLLMRTTSRHFPPSVLRPSRTQCSYKLPTNHYDPLARAVRQRLRALLSCSQQSSPPMPPSSDPSSADADADDHSSAPSPASSTHNYSIPMVYPSEIPATT
jgi:hypothetical protein